LYKRSAWQQKSQFFNIKAIFKNKLDAQEHQLGDLAHTGDASTNERGGKPMPMAAPNLTWRILLLLLAAAGRNSSMSSSKEI